MRAFVSASIPEVELSGFVTPPIITVLLARSVARVARTESIPLPPRFVLSSTVLWFEESESTSLPLLYVNVHVYELQSWVFLIAYLAAAPIKNMLLCSFAWCTVLLLNH
jgi:hypothetical protein